MHLYRPCQVGRLPCVQRPCFRQTHAGASFYCLVSLLVFFSTYALDVQVDRRINFLFESNKGLEVVVHGGRTMFY